MQKQSWRMLRAALPACDSQSEMGACRPNHTYSSILEACCAGPLLSMHHWLRPERRMVFLESKECSVLTF